MKKGKNQSWQYLNAVVGKDKVNIGILLILQSLLGISSVFYALFLRDIINGAVAGDEKGFFTAVSRFVLLACARIGIRALGRFCEEHTRAVLENRFKKRLFTTLMERDYVRVSLMHSGEWMNRLTSDTVVVANGLTDILPGLAGMLVRLVGALAMIMVLESRFIYLVLPGGLLLILFSYIFRNIMKKLHKNVQEQDGNLRMYMQESLSGMLVVRSYGVEQAITELAWDKMKHHKNARMKKNFFSNICSIGFEVVMNGAYVLGAFFCGYGILKGSMSYGTFMAVMQLIGQVQSPFASISSVLPRYYSMMASCERLMEAEDYKTAAISHERIIVEVTKMYREQLKAIILSKLSFSYRDKEGGLQVLSDVNISIQKGDCIAVMGASGCGKSTLLKLLMGMYEPNDGSIEIEMISGKKEAIREWRRLFAYVPQGNCLMSGTIREVITFYKKANDSDMTIEKAVKYACAEFIWELPDALETVLGEKGAGLSEGQMQRIAIARALYADVPVLIFDEATSALDEITEKQLLKQLKKLTDKTILIATHRKAALEICNKKLIRNQSKLV